MKNKDKKIEYEVQDEVTYLESCSYYKKLQNAVSKIVKFISPLYMLDLGCGNGNTTVRLALENPRTSIVAIEVVKERLNNSNICAKNRKVRNIAFIEGDFTKLNTLNLKNANLFLLMYSFAWLTSMEEKKQFLTNLYKKLEKGSFVLIADIFSSSRCDTKEEMERIFYDRLKEAREDVFWDALSNLTAEEISRADKLSKKVDMNEGEILNDTNKKDVRLFVSRKWLSATAEEIGFSTVLSRYVNGLNDGLVLFRK